MFEKEIIFASSDPSISRSIGSQLEKGWIRQLAPRLYSSNLKDTPEKIVRRNLFLILGHFYPGAVLSYRTAFEGQISTEGTIVVSHSYNRVIELPGVTILLVKGPKKLEGDTPFVNGLYLASRPRAFLENCRITRGQYQRSLSQSFLEEKLEQLISVKGIDSLNKLKDEARIKSELLGMPKEFDRLRKIISALQGTYSSKLLRSKPALARANQQAYDVHRVELFGNLIAYLKMNEFEDFFQEPMLQLSLQNLAFFESYFSNYIEGTQFAVDEAAKIIFDQQPLEARPADSHDILSTYELLSDPNEMHQQLFDEASFLTLLTKRHATLMSYRKDKNPGSFKEKINRAGNTTFVQPDQVIGTLKEGFELYQNLEDGFERACFMMFLVSEVHPFMDGNGRLARIMMNAECDLGGVSRIIIPTVYREDYLLSLRKLSRQGDPDAYVRMLLKAQKWTANLNFSSYESAMQQLNLSNAFLDPEEGKHRYNYA